MSQKNNPEPVIIDINTIQRGNDMQIRAEINQETVERYTEIMKDKDGFDVFPPIILFRDENNTLWLADGHHRIEASIAAGKTSIAAIILIGSKNDAIWAAIEANGKNGLSLNTKDIRRAIEIALKMLPRKTLSDISKAVAVSITTVWNVKNELEEKGELNFDEKVVGKDGKERPTKYIKSTSDNNNQINDETNNEQTITNSITEQKQESPKEENYKIEKTVRVIDKEIWTINEFKELRNNGKADTFKIYQIKNDDNTIDKIYYDYEDKEWYKEEKVDDSNNDNDNVNKNNDNKDCNDTEYEYGNKSDENNEKIPVLKSKENPEFIIKRQLIGYIFNIQLKLENQKENGTYDEINESLKKLLMCCNELYNLTNEKEFKRFNNEVIRVIDTEGDTVNYNCNPVLD
jgi:ParB-like chromosome segregation protein Spo0J